MKFVGSVAALFEERVELLFQRSPLTKGWDALEQAKDLHGQRT